MRKNSKPERKTRSVLARFFSKPFFVALLLWFLIGIVFYFLANLLIMPYVAGKFIGKVKVPALGGLPPEKARDLLRQGGLLYMLDSTGDYSVDVPAGRVLSQYPEKGTEVKQGRRIWVRISKGFKSVELPALRGLSLRQAEITLEQLGLRLGRVREVQNPALPAGAVIGTTPRAGSTLEKNRAVEIELSLGKDQAPSNMPTLTGLSLSEAKAQIEHLGLKVGKIISKKDAKSLPGTVLTQSPASGQPYLGRSVDLTVSK